MAGCYGNSSEDRYYERMLDRHLDSMDAPETETRYVCPYCGNESMENTLCCGEMHRDETEFDIEPVEKDFEYTKEDY